MKKWMSAYKIFAPDLYRLILVGIGTVVMAIVGMVLAIKVPGPIALMIATCIAVMVDAYGDYFVFVGIYGKDFGFGMLKCSYFGEEALKRGICADQMRRFLQILIVVLCTGITAMNGPKKADFMEPTPTYFGMLISLALVAYTFSSLALHMTRMMGNFMEGMLLNSIVLMFPILAVCAVVGAFFIGGADSSMPILVMFLVLSAIVTYTITERAVLNYRCSFGEKEAGRFGDEKKKNMITFLLIAFGVDFAMIPVMYYGYKSGTDLSMFVMTQMMYPACGVALFKLFSYDEPKKARATYITILITGLILMILSLASVICPMPGMMGMESMTMYYAVGTGVIALGTILLIIFISVTGKERREYAGLRFKKPLASMLYILLFLVLYFARFAILEGIMALQEHDLGLLADEFHRMFVGKEAIMAWAMVLVNLPITFIIFLGEEYGWRYYFQPELHKRFGLIKGTLLLGVLWGIWHLGADLFFYADSVGPQMVVQQIVTCVSLGIFFAYVYMKTKNIWVPVVLHFLNNNLVLILSGEFSADVLEGNTITWEMIPLAVIGMAVFWLFIFAPSFRRKEAEKVTE
ncbi:MAG: CPBP family intramembrane metalloprotease [Lachnospiraceae bacterium]|nr:CPBP family intramembrane metalloprotease [Lachnospiraceae bacterium]